MKSGLSILKWFSVNEFGSIILKVFDYFFVLDCSKTPNQISETFVLGILRRRPVLILSRTMSLPLV